MTDVIRVKAPAKINLTLDITGRLENGYHTIESVFQSVSLCDELEISLGGKEIDVSCGNGVPGGRSNICWKAALLMRERLGINRGVSVKIQKKIPSQAGLGGGSSDAAAVLTALNLMLDGGLDDEELRRIGKTLGADVPFFISGGTALVGGIGEIIKPAPALDGVHIVIAKPSAAMPTPLAYRRLDAAESIAHGNADAVLRGLESGDMRLLASGCVNSFEAVTDIPDVFEIKRKMLSCGAFLSLMSGSGSAVFGLFESLHDAEKAKTALADFPFVELCAPLTKKHPEIV